MNEPATVFISEMLKRLETNCVDYVVPRRAELLLCPPSDKDIDIIVNRKSLSQIDVLLKNVAIEQKGGCFSASYYPGSAFYQVLFPSKVSGLRVAQIHFQDSISYRGIDLVSASEMLNARRLNDGVWRPDHSVEAAALFLHDLTTKGRIPAEDFKKIRNVFLKDPATYHSLMTALTTANIAGKIGDLLKSGTADTQVAAIRREVLLRGLARRPIWTAQWNLRLFLRNVTYAFRRRGALVALVGPDGSGKTTLADSIVNVLKDCGQKAERFYFGVTTPLLPTKRWMKAMRSKGTSEQDRYNVSVPSKATFRSNFVFFLGICHSLVDQALRYVVKARMPLSRSRILVFDRYFYDALTSPAPRGLKWLLDWMVVHLSPRPDVVLVLMDSAAAIHDRKPELAVDEIKRQQRAYSKLLQRPILAKKIDIEPNPQPNAVAISHDVLMAFHIRNG